MAKVKTLDLSMNWETVCSYAILALENGTEEGKKIAREELKKMAKVADWNKENPLFRNYALYDYVDKIVKESKEPWVTFDAAQAEELRRLVKAVRGEK